MIRNEKNVMYDALEIIGLTVSEPLFSAASMSRGENDSLQPYESLFEIGNLLAGTVQTCLGSYPSTGHCPSWRGQVARLLPHHLTAHFVIGA